LNLNYKRYVNNKNRFFNIYFDTLPKHYDYVPFWPEQERVIFRKLTMDPTLKDELLKHNTSNIDPMLEEVRRFYKKHDPNIADALLLDTRVDDAFNIVNSRALVFSLKGWKLINNRKDIDENGNLFIFDNIYLNLKKMLFYFKNILL
jgi:hypothetical protein